ncbi:MAG: hypothetical protein KBT35_01890 [Firmicutes bacterium]|nr:hypothetical protein [Candidatus Colivicinus equi]
MTKEKILSVENVELDEVSGGFIPVKEPDCPYFHSGCYFIDEDHHCPTPNDRKYGCCKDCNRSY